MIKFLLRLILKDKPTTGPPSIGNILVGAAKDVLTGRADDASKFADPKCPNCKGTGWMFLHTDSSERCFCITNAVMGNVANYRREQEERRDVLRQAPQEQWRPRVDLSGFEDLRVPNVIWTEANEEQQKVEARVRLCVTLEAKNAMDAGQITMCCASSPCKCGVNHWSPSSPALGSVPRPPNDSPWYAAWEHHRQFVMAMKPPAQRPGYWYPPPGFFDQP